MSTLKFFRRKVGLSQSEIAKQLGLDQSTYCRKERGEAPFTVKEAKTLTEIFNKTVEELFFNDII